MRSSPALYVPGALAKVGRWEALAEALLQRLGPGHERIAAWFHLDRGAVEYALGDFTATKRDFDLALSLKRKVLPPNDPDIGRSLAVTAYLDAQNGDGEAALDLSQQALDIFQKAYGPQSPSLMPAFYCRGAAFEALHRYQEAEVDLRADLTTLDAQYGPDAPVLSDPLTELGKTLIAEHKYKEAAPFLERALRIRERTPLSAVDRAETEFALARAHWALNRDRPATVKMALAARDVYRPLPDCQKRVEEIDSWLSGGRIRRRSPERTPVAPLSR